MTSVIPEADRLLFKDEGDQSKEAVYELSCCSVCSAFQALEIADRAAIRLEMERVWSFHTRRLRHPVPPKYLTDRVVFSQPPPVRLVQCAECTNLYRSPRESADTVPFESTVATVGVSDVHAAFVIGLLIADPLPSNVRKASIAV